jgi:myo-inositol-1(or 4)-monophosphatase
MLEPAEINELIAAAERAAHAAAEILRAGYASVGSRVSHKGEVDLVTETDLRSEALLRELLDAETGLAFLGEEGGWSRHSTGPAWIVDPLDGTTNFVHRIPHFAVSIGLTWSARPLGGVVLSPIADECFVADAAGARLNGEPLARLTGRALDVSLLHSGFPYDRREVEDDNTDLWRALLKRSQCVRCFGAAALDMAWVAAGRADGFWEPRLKPWDLAAGIALVEAVGGVAWSFDGGTHRPESGDIVAAHPTVAAQMVEVIQAHRTKGA